MRLFGGKNNKFKVDPPKIRIEKVVIDKPAPKPKPKPNPLLGSSSRSSSTNRSSVKPPLRHKSHSPYPSSSDEKRLERKRKAGSASTSRRSPASDRIEFDKDSDAEDDGWMNLDNHNKRQRKGTADGRFIDLTRKLRSTRAFQDRVDGLSFIHAVDVASLELKCVPVMGAQKEDVAIELQYPSLQRREK